MKRFLILLFFLTGFSLICFIPRTNAQGAIPITISDAVYADLALNNYLDNVSVYMYNGNGLDTVVINSSRQWLPASTVKLYVAMYAFKQIKDQKLSLYNTYTIEDKNVVPTELVTDELPELQSGDTVNLDRLLRQMITQSDNTAYNTLLDILDRQKVTEYVQGLGLTHTRIGSKLNLDTSQEQYEFDASGYGINTTTAEDFGRAYVLIKNKKIPGSRELFSILKDQKINNMIPALLPKNVTVAHKTGDLPPLYHDGGIIESKTSSYVLSIFSNLDDPNIIAHLSELIYTRNFDLVGESLKPQKLGKEETAPLDALVLNPPKNLAVLGDITSSVEAPPITAADLGISAKDLSLSLPSHKLPRVIIPADSPWHLLIPTWHVVQTAFVLGQKSRAEIVINALYEKLSEIKDLEQRNKRNFATNELESFQKQLTRLAQDKNVAIDSDTQTTIESLSQTRFALLGNRLQNTKGDARLALIKEIATEAKDTVTSIEPNIPKAANATNPSQRPLIGEIVAQDKKSITIQTPGNQEIRISTDNPSLVIKQKELLQSENQPEESSLSSLSTQMPIPSIGTTVAIMGSSVGNKFTPTFILTNVPKELIAPQPVSVLKVNPKDKTIVTEENGIPVQINITKQTSIKADDTSVSLQSIKAGDIVVVHGESLPQKTVQKAVEEQGSKETVSPAPNTSSTQPQNTISAPQVTITSSIHGAPSTNYSQNSSNMPKVIQSTSIQVIEKKQDTTLTPSKPKPEEHKKEDKKPAPPAEQPKSQPTPEPTKEKK